MSIYRPKGSPYYHYDFQIRGHRFFGTAKTADKREAKRVEEDERKKAKQTVVDLARAKNAPLNMDAAAGRYWQEVGRHHAGADTTWVNLERLIGYFGKEKRLVDITSDDVAKMVAWRRGHKVDRHRKRASEIEDPLVSPATVNRSTVEPLKKLLNRAKNVWKLRLDHEIEWKQHKLAEPEERVRELHPEEADRLAAETRVDYEPFFAFKEASGLRLAECFLQWPDVKWSTGIIERIGKGGKVVRVVMSTRIREILLPLRGQHPENVFTYICQKASRGSGRVVGQRYPLTYSGVKSYHRRRRKRAKVDDFRLHDYRHDRATKVLRETGNLKVVQKLLNHRSIKTTVKYAHVLDDDLRAAQDRVDESRKKSRNDREDKKTA